MEGEGTYHESTEGPSKQPWKCLLFFSGHDGTVSAVEQGNRGGARPETMTRRWH